MTNNTTAPALTDEQRKAVEFAIELIENDRGDRTVTSRTLRALLTSPRAAVPALEGWKLVPVKPTAEMWAAWDRAPSNEDDQAERNGAFALMLDAAPAAPVANLSIDIEQMLRDCVPGGDIVDPQLVCDNIRSWFEDRASVAAAVAQSACRGKNCGATDGVSHSPECVAEHEAAVSGAVAADGEPLVRNLSPLERVEEDIVVMTRMSNDTKRLPMEETESLARLLYYIEDLWRAAVSPATADERAAFVEKLRELGADISPLGCSDDRLCITSNVMVDDVLAAARASQAAAPAEAREPAIEKYLWELVDEARRWESAYRDSWRRYETLDSEKKSVERTIRFIVSLFPTMVRPAIEYRYTGGTAWCDLGSAETMRADFDGVYRLKAGEFPVWSGDVPADAGEAADATRYRWLQRQRAKVWHEIADLPINHTNEYIDAAIAADGHSAQGGKGGEA